MPETDQLGHALVRRIRQTLLTLHVDVHKIHLCFLYGHEKPGRTVYAGNILSSEERVGYTSIRTLNPNNLLHPFATLQHAAHPLPNALKPPCRYNPAQRPTYVLCGSASIMASLRPVPALHARHHIWILRNSLALPQQGTAGAGFLLRPDPSLCLLASVQT